MSEVLRLIAEFREPKNLVKLAMESEMTKRLDAKAREEKKRRHLKMKINNAVRKVKWKC